MLRRDFVRAVTAVIALPRLLFAQKGAQLPLPAPTPWTQGLNPQTHVPHVVAADAVADGELKFFSKAQMATLTRLSEVLVPSVGGRPGAIEAEAPAFFDFFIGASPEARKNLYTGGLNWLEAESVKKFKMPFAKLNDEQADALLKPWLRTWMSDHPPTEPHADFINIAHDEIRLATANSPAWSIAAAGKGPSGLYWYPIEPDLRSVSAAAMHVQPHVQAVPKASHPMPSYPR